MINRKGFINLIDIYEELGLTIEHDRRQEMHKHGFKVGNYLEFKIKQIGEKPNFEVSFECEEL